MKLLRYGDTGFEKPGLMDSEGDIRDLSAVVDDITGAVLDEDKLADLKALDLQRYLSLALIRDWDLALAK